MDSQPHRHPERIPSVRFLQIDCQKQMCVRSGPPARARIDNWLWMSPRYRLRGVTSAKLVLEERALGPSVSANKGRRFTPMTSRWSFRGSPELCESLIPILQGLTRFLSRFHVHLTVKKLLCSLHASKTSRRRRIIFRNAHACQPSFFRTVNTLDYHRPKIAPS